MTATTAADYRRRAERRLAEADRATTDAAAALHVETALVYAVLALSAPAPKAEPGGGGRLS